jgi:hypothetical protein
MLIIFVDFHRKNLSVDISEEINKLGFAVRSVLDVDLTGVVLFLDLEVLLVFENVFEAFGSNELFQFGFFGWTLHIIILQLA